MTKHGCGDFSKANASANVDLHQRLYVLTESVVEAVRQRFDPEGYDPWYFTHSVRHDICRALDGVPDQERGFSRVPHPLSGIELVYREFRVKMWKSTGDMPIVGNSAGRADFLRQPFLEHYLESLGDGDLIPLKLVVAWEIDQQLHLNGFDLVCPNDYDSPWTPGTEHFAIAIPHPATQILAPTKFTEEPTELEVPLERKKTGSKNGRKS